MTRIGLPITQEVIYVRVTEMTKEILDWLDNYPGVGVYSRGWYGVFFSGEEDAVMFKLRWS